MDKTNRVLLHLIIKVSGASEGILSQYFTWLSYGSVFNGKVEK